MLTHLPGNTSIHFRKIRGSTKFRLDEKKDVSLKETGGIVRMFHNQLSNQRKIKKFKETYIVRRVIVNSGI